MNKIIETVQNITFRKWLYGVLIAVLVFLGGEGIISASQQENLGNIISSVLTVVPAAGFALAIRKAKPAVTDDTHPITPEEVEEVALAATFDWPGEDDSSSSFDLSPSVDAAEPTAPGTDPTLAARHGAN